MFRQDRPDHRDYFLAADKFFANCYAATLSPYMQRPERMNPRNGVSNANAF
jgi:hypothetical protein